MYITAMHGGWAMTPGLAELGRAEERSLGERLTEPDGTVPLMPAMAALDALYQDGNPVRIATSGFERVARRPFFASGKWRFVNRYPRWDDYHDDLPEIVGHYWRWPNPSVRELLSRGETDLFEAFQPNQWFGSNRNVFCVDFSVGARSKERAQGATTRFQCRLGCQVVREGAGDGRWRQAAAELRLRARDRAAFLLCRSRVTSRSWSCGRCCHGLRVSTRTYRGGSDDGSVISAATTHTASSAGL